MLGGEGQTALPNELAPAPTIGQTFRASLGKTTEQVNQLSGYIFPGLTTDEQRKKSADNLAYINETLSDPRQGYTQQGLNAIGGLVGSIIPTLPLAAVGGELGAGIVGALGYGAEELALRIGTDTALTTYLATQVPLAELAGSNLARYLPGFSAAELGANFVESYGAYKGFIIPEHFAEHYDAVNNSLDLSHAIQDWASDNYGFLLGAAHLAAGYVAFKGLRGIISHRNAIADSKAVDAELTRLLKQHDEVLKENQIKEGEHAAKVAKVSELQDHLQQAEEMGLISPEMHEWYLDYLENPNDQGKVHEGGLKVLQSLQIPYDRVTGRVWNEVLTRDGVKNLQSSLFDQGITQFSDEENQLLSSYIIHNELDGYIGNMRDNPNLLNAIQGMTHNLGLKIAEHSAALQKFDYALSRVLKQGVEKNHIFSQKEIYNHLRKIKVYHPTDVPYEVPFLVRKKLALERKLNILKGKKGQKYKTRITEKTIDEIKRQIKELKLHTPEQELFYLKDALMPEGKLNDNFKNKRAYHRLEELSQVWPSARHLLDRIHMEATNAKQQGLNEILKKFTEMVDNNASRLADPDGVKRYLHSRIEQSVPFVREFEQSGIELNTPAKEILNPETLYDEISQEKVKSTDLEFAKNDFDISENRYKQFSENELALNELIKCQLGE